MQKIITCKVTDEYVQGTGAVVGAVGSHNDAALELSFSEIWDGTTKRIVWYDALGQNPTLTILTVDLLVPGEAEVYRVPIPAEAKTVAGNLMMTIRGVVIGDDGYEEKAVVSATATFVVLDSVWDDNASESEDITPSQAEQLQAEIDDIKMDISATIQAVEKLDEYVEETGNNATAAKLAQTNAEKAQAAAAASSTAASNSASASSTSAAAAAASAAEAKKAAVDANGVLSFNGRAGAVVPQAGDYGIDDIEGLSTTLSNKLNRGGDIMTGPLYMQHANYPQFVLDATASNSRGLLQHSNHVNALLAMNVKGEATNMRALRLYDSVADASVTTALRFVDTVDGTNKFHTVLHTGNKPSGSYTGNADATKRTIETGGIGQAILIRSGSYIALITTNGGIAKSGTELVAINGSEAYYTNGVLTITTANAVLNGNGLSYSYTCL